jgi:hypothetical protein
VQRIAVTSLPAVRYIPVCRKAAIFFNLHCHKALYFYAVKKIFVLFSVYLLLLTALPCGDVMACAFEAATPAHQHEEEDADFCPPFCCCYCCGFSITPGSRLPELNIPETRPATPVAGFISSCPQGISYTVWQPPRYV